MHPALLLDKLLKQAEFIDSKEVKLLYDLTWKEAYKEGKRDAKETCGCAVED